MMKLRAFVERGVQARCNPLALISDGSSRVDPIPAPIALRAADVRRRMESGERFAFVDARTVDELVESPMRIERSVRMTWRAAGGPIGLA